MAIIDVDGLRKSYGPREVLHGIDLSVEENEIFGILGPNGSGKTTTVETIGGLRTRDAGTVVVAGMDPADNPPRLREVLGMQLQQCQLPGRITVVEAMRLFASFYGAPLAVDELIARFGLAAQARTRFEKLSGGQQQRLSVALALVGNPRIAILDETTTGLDPQARRDIWEYLAALRRDGTTILLVTHYMEEAQYLCDRVAIIDDGVVVALGTPAALAGSRGEQETSFLPSRAVAAEVLRALPGVRAVRVENGRVVVSGDGTSTQTVLAKLIELGVTAQDLRVTSPTLDSAYLSFTDDGPTPAGTEE